MSLLTAHVSRGISQRITAPALVHARWLIDHSEHVRVLDARPADVRRAQGCVPRSRVLPASFLGQVSSEHAALLAHADHVQQVLARLGVRPDEHVVVIDDGDGTASFAASVCALAGMRHTSAAVGNAVREWHALGGDVAPVADDAPGTVAVDAWRDVSPQLDGVATFAQLEAAVTRGTARVLDVRSQLEHEGLVGTACCAGAGSIPGSVHLEWTSLLDHAGQPHRREVLETLLHEVGIAPDEPLIVTCHAGHRAATAARILRTAGMRNVRLSTGSWHEWSHRRRDER